MSNLALKCAAFSVRRVVSKGQRHIGIGMFGTVWLEKCTSDGGSKLRAVKEVRKIRENFDSIDYDRELEAIAKLSQQKVQ